MASDKAFYCSSIQLLPLWSKRVKPNCCSIMSRNTKASKEETLYLISPGKDPRSEFAHEGVCLQSDLRTVVWEWRSGTEKWIKTRKCVLSSQWQQEQFEVNDAGQPKNNEEQPFFHLSRSVHLFYLNNYWGLPRSYCWCGFCLKILVTLEIKTEKNLEYIDM